MVMTSWVLWVSGGHPHPRVKRVKPGDGTSVMVAPGKNHLKQRRSVSIALFLTQNLFVASGIDYLIYLTRPLRSENLGKAAALPYPFVVGAALLRRPDLVGTSSSGNRMTSFRRLHWMA